MFEAALYALDVITVFDISTPMHYSYNTVKHAVSSWI